MARGVKQTIVFLFNDSEQTTQHAQTSHTLSPRRDTAPFARSSTSSTLNLRVQSRRVTRSVILPIRVPGNHVFDVAQPIQCRKLVVQGSHSAVRVGGRRGEAVERGSGNRHVSRRAMAGGKEPKQQDNARNTPVQPTVQSYTRSLPQVWKAPSSSCLCFGHHRSCAALRPRAYTFFCLCKHWEHGAPTSREHDRPVVYQYTLVDLTARLLVPATCSHETSTSEAL